MTAWSAQLWALAERAPAPLAAFALLGAIAVAAGSQDLMKRLVAALLAALAGLVELAAAGVAADLLVTFTLVVVAAGVLGFVLVARIGEDFHSVDTQHLADGQDRDEARAESGA